MTKNILIRGIDGDVYRRARSRAVDKDLTMGHVVTELLRKFIRGEVGVTQKKKGRDNEKHREDFIDRLGSHSSKHLNSN